MTTNTSFFCIHNILKMKHTSAKKHTEHCLTHLLVNKTACKIWSVFDKIHFWVNYLMPFSHGTLQLQNDAFHVKTSQSASSILQKNENWPQKRCTPFLHGSLQLWHLHVSSSFYHHMLETVNTLPIFHDFIIHYFHYGHYISLHCHPSLLAFKHFFRFMQN